MKVRPFYAVLEREMLRMLRQRTRLVAAMVRPLIWLLVIGGGFSAAMGNASGVDYQGFLVPGVLGMTTLFGAMLAALTTVYDKESGVMRMMIVAPLPHAWIVLAKMVSAALAAIVQSVLLLVLLLVLGRFGFRHATGFCSPPPWSATSFACAGIGMLTASFSRTLDNFAATMNFVIFPVFFFSGSLYPVQTLPAVLKQVAAINPYTYGVDFLKHAILPGSVDGLQSHAGHRGACRILDRRAGHCKLAILSGVGLRADDPRACRAGEIRCRLSPLLAKLL